MRIAVTGREGQIARALAEKGAANGHEIILLGRPDFDLTNSAADIANAVTATRADIIVSAAAYTAVDRAETERDLAFAVNAAGAEAVAHAARGLDVPLVHLSTDYVFNGRKASPYSEDDVTDPQSIYGKSKLAGEGLVQVAQPNSVILRTAWVFSPFGANFVKTMLRVAGGRDEVAVVDDQRGNPTSASDIADAIFKVAINLKSDSSDRLRGIFHMTSRKDSSWAELAEAIFAISSRSGGPSAKVRRIGTADYPTAAPRPLNSRLECALLEAKHGVRIDDWHQSLAEAVQRILTAH